jgi:hypothetical protein
MTNCLSYFTDIPTITDLGGCVGSGGDATWPSWECVDGSGISDGDATWLSCECVDGSGGSDGDATWLTFRMW